MRKILIVVAAVLMGLVATPVMAEDNNSNNNGIDEGIFNPICDKLDKGSNEYIEAGCDRVGKGTENTERVINIINVAIGLTGLVAVVVVVFGGQRYLTSAGDAGRVKQAKDMIMYGLIGVVVAALAWAIINFLIGTGIFDTPKQSGFVEWRIAGWVK